MDDTILEMALSQRAVTADELFEMPAERGIFELVRGELRPVSPAGFRHGTVTAVFVEVLSRFVRAHRLGVVCTADTGFILERNPDTVLAPDCAFVRRDRLGDGGLEPKFFPGPPDLALEVISPHDRYTEVSGKVRRWLDAGTRMVVVIAPAERSVTVHHLDGTIRMLRDTESLRGGDVVPGWSLPVAELFES